MQAAGTAGERVQKESFGIYRRLSRSSGIIWRYI